MVHVARHAVNNSPDIQKQLEETKQLQHLHLSDYFIHAFAEKYTHKLTWKKNDSVGCQQFMWQTCPLTRFVYLERAYENENNGACCVDDGPWSSKRDECEYKSY